MARPSRNSCTAYALRNYSQKDVLNVQVTEASVHAVLDCSSVLSACRMWLEKVLILVNNSSSAELQRSSNVSASGVPANVHRSDRAARRRTASIRCWFGRNVLSGVASSTLNQSIISSAHSLCGLPTLFLPPIISGWSAKLMAGERYIHVWATDNGRVPFHSIIICPNSYSIWHGTDYNNMRWGNALSHKLEVGERRSLASHYTLTTAHNTKYQPTETSFWLTVFRSTHSSRLVHTPILSWWHRSKHSKMNSSQYYVHLLHQIAHRNYLQRTVNFVNCCIFC